MMPCLEGLGVAAFVVVVAVVVMMMMMVEKKGARGSEEETCTTRKSGCQGHPANRIISLDGFKALPLPRTRLAA